EIPMGDDEQIDAGEPALAEPSAMPSEAGSGGEDEAAMSAPPEFERIAPREPLSELSLALPPKPKAPGEWKGTILHRAVAPSAGVIEAMGYRVAIAGIEPVSPGESCDFDGRPWECGVYARTA